MKVRGELILKNDFDILMNENDGVRAISKFDLFLGSEETYLLYEKGIIALYKKGKIIYYNEVETQSIIENMDSHIFKSVNCELFISKVDNYVLELSKHSLFEYTKIDISFQSLENIEMIIFEEFSKGHLIESNLFYPLVAYSSKVLQHITNGNWIIREEISGDCVYIKPENHSVDVFDIVRSYLMDIYKYGLSVSIKSKLGYYEPLKLHSYNINVFNNL